MKALVTGGAGFIGSAIARALVERGVEVRVFDNLVSGFRENIPDGIKFVLGDLRDLDSVRMACRDIEVVFHQAAIQSVARSVDDPLLTEGCNALGTLNVLIAAEESGTRRVVYASSCSVYGDASEGPNREDAAPNPLSPYAVSKLTGEQYCRVWTRLKGLSTVSLRYFNVFGPGQHPESKYAAVFPAFISALASGRAPEVHWDGDQSRDFVFIEDVVNANLLAAEADGHLDGAVINIGGGRAKTVNEVLRSVSEAFGKWIEPVRAARHPGDLRHTRADIRRAKELLGWEPRAEWEQAVEATVRWFMDARAPCVT